jgi:capsule polysaccharide export protein KpsE/RkpR
MQKKEFIERVLLEKQLELDSIDRELEKYQKENKVLAIDKQTQAIVTNAITIGSELAKAEIELNIMLQEYEQSSPTVRIQKEKVANLKNQYNRIQSGGLTSTDEFSIPLQNIPNIIREYN